MCIRDSQYIVFVVQHGQMDAFLNTFLIGIIRQLLISPIPRDAVSYTHLDVYKRQVLFFHYQHSGIGRYTFFSARKAEFLRGSGLDGCLLYTSRCV